MALSQGLSKPEHLCHTVSNSPELRLGNRLPLGRPGNKVAAQEHGIPRGGAASVRTASPISVGVDNQLSRGGGVKNQAEVNRAMDVAEALQRSNMGLPRIMHMKANLLNGICEVRPCESEILQGSGKTPVGSDQTRDHPEDQTRLAISHPITLHDIKRILSLVKKKTRLAVTPKKW
jgi:hypothetical protein